MTPKQKNPNSKNVSMSFLFIRATEILVDRADDAERDEQEKKPAHNDAEFLHYFALRCSTSSLMLS